MESINNNQLWNSKITFEYKVVSSQLTTWDFQNPKHQLLKNWIATK